MIWFINKTLAFLKLEKDKYSDANFILGFILLTISLLSGAPFVIQDNSIHIIQKILFSLIAWITFAYLLYKRFSYGVRGKKAVHITLSGIIFLLIAYLGTKFLFEALSV